jgi:hypothetical protein
MVAVSFLISSCADNYPDVHPRLIDWKRQRFLNHELVDRKSVQFEATTWDSDLSKLNGNYCLSGREMGELAAWARRQQNKSSQSIGGELQ